MTRYCSRSIKSPTFFFTFLSSCFRASPAIKCDMELLANPPSSAVQAACKGNGSTGTESAKYDGYHSRSSFLSNPLSSMQSLKPLDYNDLQADMQHQMLQRRHNIKGTFEL